MMVAVSVVVHVSAGVMLTYTIRVGIQERRDKRNARKSAIR